MKNSENSNNIETIYKVLDEKVEALEFQIREDAPYLNKPLRELKNQKHRNHSKHRPKPTFYRSGGDDCIMLGDNVIVVSSTDTLHDLKEIFV